MIPPKLGRYEIQAEIGLGAMGRVYRALDPLCQRLVAIKAIRWECLSQTEREEYLKRFYREAQAAGGLSHPNIVTIFDVGDDYLVMEYLDGTPLLNLLAERGMLPLSEALPILSPIADALDYAHRRGVIHRDIKPGNIMILRDGTPKLMDFGLARVESAVMTKAGQLLGSPAYMSPEQILGAELTPRTDLYSLAVVTYEMLTGNKPFPGESISSILYRVIHEDPIPPCQRNLSLPPRYDDVFRHALAKKPDERFATASELVAALNLKEFDEIQIPTVSVSWPGPATAPPIEGVETVDLHGLPGTPVVAHREGPQAMTERESTLTRPIRRVRGPLMKLRVPRRPLAAVALGTALLAAAVLGAAGLFLARKWVAPPPGVTLHVDSAPPGAAVWLDEAESGVTPFTVSPVSPGPHKVRVVMDGFVPAEQTVELQRGKTPEPLFFSLQASRASLSLRSDPEGAAIKVDGRSVGLSPVEDYPLDPGFHEIRAERKGFLPWRLELTTQAGESLDLAARLERPPAPAAAGKGIARRPRTSIASEKRASSPTTPSTGETSPPAEGPSVVEIGPGIKPPRKISGEFAGYPEEARTRRIEGAVLVEMIITEAGEVVEPRVIESAGEVLDRALLDAVRSWRYEPAEKDGQKVRVRWRVRQTFKIGA